MRELKFRAWDSEKLREVTQLHFRKNNMDAHINTPHGSAMVTGRPIMQYTGLKGNNDVEIYEGDIVIGVAGEYEGEIWEISWVEDRDYAGWSIQPDIEVKVIGNIYENPELIK